MSDAAATTGMTALDAADYLTAVRREVDRVADIVASLASGDDPSVAACPGWGVRQVVAHLGGVHRMVIAAVAGRSSRSADHLPPEGTELAPWLRAGADEMLALLDAPGDTPAWSFDPAGRSVAFWQRRQAMEALVHRIDVEIATDSPTPVDPALAADGVSEVLDTLMRLRLAAGVLELPASAITLTANDTGNSWSVGMGDPAAVVTAPAAQLLRALWKRSTAPSALTIEGDRSLAEAFLASSLTP